ncbi:hypothetical protein IFM89_009227, partial [Coptis chinensis]
GKCDGAGLSEDDQDNSGGETELLEIDLGAEDRELKNHLLKKYSGYLGSLKQELSKKKKKKKVALAESTGLDKKQINNWCINQRKRHWKPSEDMQFVVMDGLHAQNAAVYMEGHFMVDACVHVQWLKHASKGVSFTKNGKFAAILICTRKDCKDLDLADIEWSPDDSAIVVWDSSLDYKEVDELLQFDMSGLCMSDEFIKGDSGEQYWRPYSSLRKVESVIEVVIAESVAKEIGAVVVAEVMLDKEWVLESEGKVLRVYNTHGKSSCLTQNKRLKDKPIGESRGAGVCMEK